MKFTEIDMKTWPRAQEFRVFSAVMATEFSITSELDVTKLVDTLHQKGLKFYPVYLWLVTRELIKQPEFRTSLMGGKLGVFDTLAPIFPVFHPENKSITNLWVDYHEDFHAFLDDYNDVMKKYGSTVNRFYARRDLPAPPNTYVISCIPWLNFTHFSAHNLSGQPRYLPSVDSGKYVEKNGKLMMPVSLTCHHAVSDGYHFSLFFEGLQEAFDSFEG